MTDVIGSGARPNPDAAPEIHGSQRASHVDGPSTLTFRENVGLRRLARVVDVVAASSLLILVAPVVAAASVSILLDDGPPIFFRQRRVGRFGRLFTMNKLRTMQKADCSDVLSPTSGHDPRITRVGYWLRKLSIDELPQLLNIISGEMTFVGPRPEMPFLVRNYEPWQNLRHLVKPGLTGRWQTTCRSTVPLHLPEATLFDLEHVRNRSFLSDALVLAKTFRMLISPSGAY